MFFLLWTLCWSFTSSRTFFDVLHPDEVFAYLPSLEVLSYEGNLVVQAIDFLEPLLLRSRMREGNSRADGNLERIAVLRKVKIQVSNSAEFSIAETLMRSMFGKLRAGHFGIDYDGWRASGIT